MEAATSLAGPWTTETLGNNVTLTGNNLKYTFPTPTTAKRFARLRVSGP